MTNQSVNTKSEISTISASARVDKRNFFQRLTQPLVDLIHLPKIVSSMHAHLQAQHDAHEWQQHQIELLQQQLANQEAEFDQAVLTLIDRNANLRTETERWITQLEEEIGRFDKPGSLEDKLDSLSIKMDKRLTELEDATDNSLCEFEQQLQNLQDQMPAEDGIANSIEESIDELISDNDTIQQVVQSHFNEALLEWQEHNDLADAVEEVMSPGELFSDWISGVDLCDYIDFDRASTEVRDRLDKWVSDIAMDKATDAITSFKSDIDDKTVLEPIDAVGFITAQQCLELIEEKTESKEDIETIVEAIVEGSLEYFENNFDFGDKLDADQIIEMVTESDDFKGNLDETIANHLQAYDNSLAESQTIADSIREFVIDNQCEIASIITDNSEFELNVQSEVKAQWQMILKSLFQSTTAN